MADNDVANGGGIVGSMIRELDYMRAWNGPIGKVRRYLLGGHDLPYMPKDATVEYESLARQAITNMLPLISGGFSGMLYVDGYRSGKSADNVAGWARWQANKLDARQAITMRGAIEYGTAYVSVEGEKIRALNARKSHALYEDDDADYPYAGLAEIGERIASDGSTMTRYEFFMGGKVWTYERTNGRVLGIPDDPANPLDGRDIQVGKLDLIGTPRTHGKDFVPWVRFRDRLDDDAQGVIRPLINLQDRINASVFYLLMALHYASFRQRWATGLIIPRDTQETLPDGSANPNFGRPIEPFKAAVNRLWLSESQDTKFGDFAQTETSGHLAAIENAMGALISIGQASPLLLSGNHISNIAIDAIAALNDSMNKKVDSLKSNFGESWEEVLRLSGAGDDSAAVRWRETEPRSFAQVVDGLVKLNTIGAPAEGLFEMVPNITDQQLAEWKTLAARQTDTDRLAEAITRQAGPALPDAGATDTPPPADTPPPVVGQ